MWAARLLLAAPGPPLTPLFPQNLTGVCYLFSLYIRWDTFFAKYLRVGVDHIQDPLITQNAPALLAPFTEYFELVGPFLEFGFDAVTHGDELALWPYNCTILLGTDWFYTANSSRDDMLATFDGQANTVLAVVARIGQLCNVTSAEANQHFNSPRGVMASAVIQLIRNPSKLLNAVKSAAIETAFLVHWFPYVLGFLSFAVAIAYHIVSRDFQAYETELKEIDNKLLDIRSAGLRVAVTKGTQCIVQHQVNRPKINGHIGTIDSDEVDASGRVSVRLVDEKTGQAEIVLLEEYQMAPHLKPDEMEEVKEMATLKVAEAKYEHETRGNVLGKREQAYVITCQILSGFCMHGLVSFASTSRFASLGAYNALTNGVMVDLDTRRHFEDKLCEYWTMCWDSSVEFCKSCHIDLTGSGIHGTDLYPKTVPQDVLDIFRDPEVVTNILIWASSTGAIGFIVFWSLLRCTGQMGHISATAASIMVATLCFFTGASLFVLAPSYTARSPAAQQLCEDPNAYLNPLIPLAPGERTLPMACLLETGAEAVNDDGASPSYNALLLGFLTCTINQLLESISFLSGLLKNHRGAEEWALFEHNLFIGAYFGAQIVLTSCDVLDRYTGVFTHITSSNFRLLFHAQYAWSHLGDHTLLKSSVKGLSPLEDWNAMLKLARTYGYSSSLGFFIIVGLSFFQIIGVVAQRFASGSEGGGRPAQRAVLIMNFIVFATYILLLLCLAISGPFISQMLACILLMPLCFQVSSPRHHRNMCHG